MKKAELREWAIEQARAENISYLLRGGDMRFTLWGVDGDEHANRRLDRRERDVVGQLIHEKVLYRQPAVGASMQGMVHVDETKLEAAG